MKRSLLFLLALWFGLAASAQLSTDSIRKRLLHAPVQEKVYLHIDNNCYFKGDTIWYKAYVVRADSLTYTDMSRMLYVELVSPDGMVVERQCIIVSPQGYSDGNFTLRDSIYSGFYELRAYTRWMLNFRVSQHDYGRKDREYFYNKQMAADFFRQFETVYSRVVPVYERPEKEGDYTMKYVVSRPKTRIEKEEKDRLTVSFYPEGGHLVAGQRCRLAFEATDEQGRQIDIKGSVGQQSIATEHQGRGAFTIDVPQQGSLPKAHFNYKGKDYDFSLPKTESHGCALQLIQQPDHINVSLAFGHYLPGIELAAAVLCRGVLYAFEPVAPDNRGRATLRIDRKKLPTGVCNLVVFDEMGSLLADRLFFIDHGDYGQTIDVEGDTIVTYEPFQPIELTFKAPADAHHLSISVRDGSTDDPTYDTGNMMTDLLLSSELRGFVAYPDYYFEADDDFHRRHLDLLMMVQGWRRYDFGEMTSGKEPRYQPETALTVEGAVYPTSDEEEIEPDEVRYWAQNVFGYSPSKAEAEGALDAPGIDEIANEAREGTNNSVSMEKVDPTEGLSESENPETVDDPWFGINHGGVHKEVTVEGELVFEDDIATVSLETNNGGRFAFAVPPYYGQAILFLKAHDTDISEKKAKRLDNKGILDETAWPEYYVKRDLFYPVFAKKYSYYQCHLPDVDDTVYDDDSTVGTQEHLSKFDRELGEVTVKQKRRRGRRAIDYSKPACVYDAQELYNLATDRGLSFGRYNARRFPMQVSMALLGNYNSDRRLQVMARLNDRELSPYIFYRNYDPGPTVISQNRGDGWIGKNIKLNRQDEIRLYTDFELRNEDKHVEQTSETPDVTLDFMLVENDGERYTYRDRRLILNGMTEPASFYHPNYQERPLPDTVKDYRRTLYWNPNARLDQEGRFTAKFFNNGKQTRIRISAAGLTDGGHPISNNSKP